MKKKFKSPNISFPERTCVGCLTKKNKFMMIRFIRHIDGSVVLDRKQNLHGRGVYVCTELGCLEIAIKKNQFARVFRQKILIKSYDPLISEFKECLKTNSEQ